VGNEAEIDGKQAQAAGHRPPLPDRPVEKLDEAGPQHLDLTVVRQAGRAQESKLSLLARHQERVGDPPWQVRMARNRGKVLQFPGERGGRHVTASQVPLLERCNTCLALRVGANGSKP
jgi:hypothetical protein